MGPVEHPQQTGTLDDLVQFPGSAYSDPEFSWLTNIGVTGMHFLFGSALGEAYDDVLLVGCINGGHLWAFRLNHPRKRFVFDNPNLRDLVDDTENPLADPAGAENEEIVLGVGFGTVFSGILAIERGADGWPYVLTGQGKLYRIRLTPGCPADIDGNGIVNSVDLITLLICLGEPATGFCDRADLNGDGFVNSVDLIDFLGELGTLCP